MAKTEKGRGNAVYVLN